jgi:NADH:ubiquinone oxidoreductase subunit E
MPDMAVYICTGSKCGKRGGKDLYKSVKAFSKHYGGDKEIEAIRIECTDRCKFAPVCAIQPGNIWLKEYADKEVLKLLHDLVENKG